MIRIVIAEDHQIVREGLRALLAAERDFEVVADTAEGERVPELVAARGADVVIMDISLQRADGVEAVERLRRSGSQVPVVMLSMHDDHATVDRALRAGARGYVLKGAGVAMVTQAVRAVLRGEVFLSPGISEYVLRGYLATAPPEDPLSARERDLLRLIAEGYTSREIAHRLELKPKTVENQRARLMEKLDVHTTAGLVRYAMQVGLVR